MNTEKKIAAHYFEIYKKMKKMRDYDPLKDISYNGTVFLTITEYKIMLGIGAIPIPSIGIKLPGPKKLSLETLVEAADLFGYEYVLTEDTNYSSKDLFDSKTEGINNFKQIKISETTTELPESTILYISDPKSYIDPEFGNVSKKTYNKDYSNGIINPEKEESMLFFVVGGKSSIKNIEEIYRRYYGSELSQRIALSDIKANQNNNLYRTAVEQVERTKKKERRHKHRKTVNERENNLLKNLFKETKKRTTIKEITEFINVVAEKIKEDNKSHKLENKISYTNKEKSMLFTTKKDTEKYNQYITSLYINNIAYESKYQLLKRLSKSKGTAEYFLEFERIPLSIFSEILKSKNPFANYINAALKAVTIEYESRPRDINITFKDFENNSFKDYIKIEKNKNRKNSLKRVTSIKYDKISDFSEMEIIIRNVCHKEKTVWSEINKNVITPMAQITHDLK